LNAQILYVLPVYSAKLDNRFADDGRGLRRNLSCSAMIEFAIQIGMELACIETDADDFSSRQDFRAVPILGRRHPTQTALDLL